MGYYASTCDCRITIPADRQQECYHFFHEKYYTNMPHQIIHYTPDTLEGIMEDFNFEVEVHSNNDIVITGYLGEKYGITDQVLSDLAPFVTPDSYSLWSGEDCTYWYSGYDVNPDDNQMLSYEVIIDEGDILALLLKKVERSRHTSHLTSLTS